VSGQQGRERRGPHLLLAFDEQRHPDRWPSAERAQHGQVDGDATLVVGRAATEEPSVPLGGREGLRAPARRIPFGLHVVMGVEAHRRPTGRRGKPGEHRGRTTGPHDLHVVAADRRDQVGHRLRAALHLVRPAGVGTDRLDGHQSAQIGHDSGKLRLDGVSDGYGTTA
jgi:hypothetical protein